MMTTQELNSMTDFYVCTNKPLLLPYLYNKTILGRANILLENKTDPLNLSNIIKLGV